MIFLLHFRKLTAPSQSSTLRNFQVKSLIECLIGHRGTYSFVLPQCVAQTFTFAIWEEEIS